MGAGILPTCIINNKLYFLFGKENKYEDSAPGFSDFGGGTDLNETFFNTALREASEELTGFLGDKQQIKKLLKSHGTFNIDYKSDGNKTYRMHIFPFVYDEKLVYYYNNNHKFLSKHLSSKIFKTTKIFEKDEIRWICIDDLSNNRSQFRNYFTNIIDLILENQEKIQKFIKKSGSQFVIKINSKNFRKYNKSFNLKNYKTYNKSKKNSKKYKIHKTRKK